MNNLRTIDFDYELPSELIAQRPPDRRDSSRLLCLNRSNSNLTDRNFSELPDLLRDGDLLVVNDTSVIPAKFDSFRRTGGKVEGLFLRETDGGTWLVMLKNAGRCKPGEPLSLGSVDGEFTLTLLTSHGEGRWTVEVTPLMPAAEILETVGQVPLPPYIRRDDAQAFGEEDRKRYQTVYAANPGAVAAPTAGLHFTDDIFARLALRDINVCHTTLHVGAGTFLPVKTEDLNSHQMHSEVYELTAPAAETLNSARAQGRRIVAVGTTAVRVLETAGRGCENGTFVADSGSTDIFLYPPAEFCAVDALITNFHLPKSTLVMLVAAFCSPGGRSGIETILNAYRHAVQRRYRFFSYGDAMLIE